jgi:hypothetical protein
MSAAERTSRAASRSLGEQPPRELPPGRLPDFFIAGHPKCGTTALYRMLRAHPQIFMPELKEPWFFSLELRSPFPGPKLGMRPDTLAEYMALFSSAAPAQRAGEASSSYLMSSTAARRIAELQPQARVIAILREPASFLRSYHLQCVRVHVEDERDLGTALALEPERRAGRRIPRHSPRPQALLYSEHVRYVEQLRRYRERFPAEQLLVLIYDDFRAENEATVRRVLRFLEVDETVAIAPVQANPAVRVRSQGLHRAVQAVSVGRGPVSQAVKAGVKAVTSRRLRRAALRGVRRNVVFAAPQPPEEALMRELRRRFRGEVEALSEYLERDLVRLWGYDHERG